MGLDADLVAAVTLHHRRGAGEVCGAHDVTFQLSLAHVLLDGGYDGVATLGEVMGAGDHGLGTVDRLDGELVVVDGEPWRVDAIGRAELMPPDTLTPFVVLTTMESPMRTTVEGLDRDGVMVAIDRLLADVPAHQRSGVIAVRLEGRFSSVLVRSVPAQSPPYRPYVEVCASDEVRWHHENFEGVFVGFCFPDLGTPDIIGGLHLHGLDDRRSTGGHNHELVVDRAQLSVSLTHEVDVTLPDRSMIELLEMPAEYRSIQRELLRRGGRTATQLAVDLEVDLADINQRLAWLADRGFAAESSVESSAESSAGLSAGSGTESSAASSAELGAAASGGALPTGSGEPIWQITMQSRAPRLSPRLEDMLDDLIDE